MERLAVDPRQAPREENEGQNRNQNFRRPPVPQIRKREQRNPTDHPVRPPFQEHFVAADYEYLNEDQIHQVDQNDARVYLTKEEHDRWCCEKDGEVLDTFTENYKLGYQNAVMELEK